MSPTCPPNLTQSTAHLKDNPYDVQLGVLKWIRALVFEVIDQASTRAVLADKSSGEHGNAERMTLAQIGRKRPRTGTLHGRDGFRQGSVVECFHADDGLWYPATITAVIPPPPEAPAGGVHSEEVSTEEALPKEPTQSTKAPIEGSPLPLLSELPLPSAQPSPSKPASESTAPIVSVGCKKGEGGSLPSPPKAMLGGRSEEEDGATDTPMEVATAVEAAAPTLVGKEGGEENVRQEQQEHPLLDVTFLGYGNQSRVPRDWVRKIVTPEVLKWCNDNGIVQASAEGSLDDSCPVNIGTTQAATREGTPGDGDGAATSAGTLAQMTVCPNTPDNDGEQLTAEAGERGAVGGGSGGNGGKGKQQPRKRKKNKNNNKNNRNYRNNNKGAKRQVGTEEEEEERFLMRCASRTKSPYTHVPNKYWGQRYRYFSRFDEGIGMDKEGWYSVTPEAIALHIAERVCCDIVVDPFAGCGGNAVQFALVSHVVFAIDIDPVKLEHARRNATVYGVENRIEFILGDAMKVLPTLKADVVFLSPPWGGPAYQDSKTFDLHSMIPPPLSALEMFRAAREVTPNVVFFLPRNVNAAQVAGLPAAAAALEAGEIPAASGVGIRLDDTCELEKQFLNGKLKTTTAYFGEDIAVTVGKKRANNKGSDANAGLDMGDEVVEQSLHQQGHRALDPSAHPNGSSDWYGDGGKGVTTWSGRHVRFSEDDEAAGTGNDGTPSMSHQRENALYEAWMTR